MGGDAAEETVRLMLNGTEIAVRLTGSAVKNLASLLIEWSKKEKKVYGKTTMMKLLNSGETLEVLTLSREQYKAFKEMARKKVLYAPFVNAKEQDGKVDLVISKRSIPIVNYILERIGYGTVGQKQEEEESKKKDSPSRQSSGDAKARSKEPDVTKPGQKTEPERESVLTRLEANRKYLESHSGQGREQAKNRGRKTKGTGR